MDKKIALLSQAILYLSKVLEKQAPVPDSAPFCNSLLSLQCDRCIFFGSFAAPAPWHREKCTVRSPLLSNTRSSRRSFLRCCSTGQSPQQLCPLSRGFISGTGSKRLRLDMLSDVVQTKESTGISGNIQHTSCPTWILELFPWTYVAHQWHLKCQTKIPHKREDRFIWSSFKEEIRHCTAALGLYQVPQMQPQCDFTDNSLFPARRIPRESWQAAEVKLTVCVAC